MRGKRTCAVVLSLLLVCCMMPASAAGDTKTSTTTKSNTTTTTKAVTTVTGVPTEINKRLNQHISFTIKVSPANGRVVKLQRYDINAEKYKTIRTYTTENKSVATLTVNITKKYRQKALGTWRIYVPATDKAKKYKSKKFHLYTRNIKKKSLSAKTACVYCIETDQFLYTKKATTKRAQASTTKLMSAVVAVESGKIGKNTKITRNAAKTPWGSEKMKVGDVYRNMDLIWAMMLPSANDAAVAIAEGTYGSTSAFVNKMNAKAKAMGWTNTQFKNPHGLDAAGHYTTARELAELTAYAFAIPKISQCWTVSKHVITSVKYKRSWTLWSTDSLIGYLAGFLGGKTGTEDNALYCFTGVYKYKNKHYVTVVLGAKSEFYRWLDTKKLHSYVQGYASKRY